MSVESQIERARSVLDSRGVAYDVVSPLGNNAAAERSWTSPTSEGQG